MAWPGTAGPWRIRASVEARLAQVANRARFRLRSTSWVDLGDSAEALFLQSWISTVNAAMLSDRTCVAHMRFLACKTADRLATADRRQAAASWRSWLQEGPCAGLARQHRMTRIATGWIPSTVASPCPEAAESVDGNDVIGSLADEADEPELADVLNECVEVPLDCQQTVAFEADKWAREWQVGQSPPLPIWPAALGEPMPTPCLHAARQACKSFAAGTGLGWDRLHPRVLLRCSEQALLALLRLFILAELLGTWPQQIGVVIVALLPKPDGGRRPIGLFPSLVRLWMRIRLAVAQTWQSAHERPYFYAGPAKGADVAAWKQAARAELGAALEVDYGAVLLDLVKAFERVPHDWLVRQAVRFHYNLFLLRLSLAAYVLPRTIRIGGAYSALVIATRGITAGSVLATAELRVLLIEWLDEVAWSCALVTLTVYVDDIAVEAVATEHLLLEALIAAVRLVISRLLAMRLAFSETKNVCIASRASLGRTVVQAFPELSLSYCHRVVSLGSGLGGGRRRNAQVSMTRLAKFVKRRGRFRRLRRAGVNTSRLMRSGGTAALQFGQAVVGVSPTMLLRQRRAVAAATVPSNGGGDLDITLMLADGGLNGRADPAFAAHRDPIGHWAMAMWESWVPHGGLRRLVVRAKHVLAVSRRPWAMVRGPAAAFVASAHRLRWTVHDAFRVTLDNDDIFNSNAPRIPPGLVSVFFQSSVELVSKSVSLCCWTRGLCILSFFPFRQQSTVCKSG